MKQPAIYIMASEKNGTIYTGVTSNLPRRIFEHKEGLIKGFSKQYNCKVFVYYEFAQTMECAIIREKQIKNYSRKKKVALIEQLNPEWKDLYEHLI